MATRLTKKQIAAKETRLMKPQVVDIEKAEAMRDLVRAEKKKTIIARLEENTGNLTSACNEIGTNVGSVYDWMAKDSNFRKDIETAIKVGHRKILDLAKLNLVKGLKEEDKILTMFTLKSIGKDEGFSERQEITGREGKDFIPIKFVDTEE